MLHKARDQNNGFLPIPLFKMTMVYVAYLSATAKQMPQSSNDFFFNVHNSRTTWYIGKEV